MNWLDFTVQDANLGAEHDVCQVGSKYKFREKEKDSQESSFLSYEEED